MSFFVLSARIINIEKLQRIARRSISRTIKGRAQGLVNRANVKQPMCTVRAPLKQLTKLLTVLLIPACSTPLISKEILGRSPSGPSIQSSAGSSSRPKAVFETHKASSVLSYGEVFTYQAYVPQSYGEMSRVPLVVFLHGAGERLGGYKSATSVGMGVAIRKKPELFPAIVIFPHCPENEWWSTTKCHDSFLSVLQDAQHRYLKIDPRRQYLTGLSMGGYGVWVYGERYHSQWAAFMPVAPRSTAGGGFHSPLDVASGRFDDKERYYRVAKVFEQDPIWLVHGDIDPVIPVSESRNIAYHLQQLGNGQAKYLELKGRGHDIWDDVYQDEGMIGWLLSQSK